jgi:hypothetical protein
MQKKISRLEFWMSYPQFCLVNRKVSWLVSCIALGMGVVIASSAATTSETGKQSPQPSQPQSQQWRRMNSKEQAQAWEYILNSPLGIAALNQLAIEGFISPVCPKTFYLNKKYEGFQTLLQVKCPDQRGVSSAIAYDEMRVIFNRFESTIESFEVERVSPERPSTTMPE